jgi:putative ribosome biogenesis GTPase RsgA
MTNEQHNKQIFLCMGNTGTGKSTFIRSMGGAVDPKELVASEDSLTTRTMFYSAGPTATVLLVDTPGLETHDLPTTRIPSPTPSIERRYLVLSKIRN